MKKPNRRSLLAMIALPTVVVALSTSSCTGPSGQQREDSKLSSQAYEQQASAVPYPASQLRDSLERRNLKERLLRTNEPNRLQYVYLLGDTGTYIGYYAIKGKVSSNQSQMLQQDSIVLPCSGCDRQVVDGPGDDGSYGDDEPGIFFFTTEGVMVATDMRYLVADAPLSVSAPKLNVPKS